jgi:methylmalonyl-CoA/ethylmalonyl-CoA epimerase
MAERLIEGVDHVQVPVKDIGIGCKWYSEVLGLETITKLDHAAWLKFNEGPLLMLHRSSKDTHVSWLSEDDFPMPGFMFITRDIKKLKEVLDKNDTIIRMYQDEGFGWVIKFVDPFGNELGAYEPKKSDQ